MKPAIAIRANHCPICGIRIREVCECCGRPRPLPNLLQVQFKHLPDNLTWIAMCAKCFDTLDESQARAVFAALQDTNDAYKSWEFIKVLPETALFPGEIR